MSEKDKYYILSLIRGIFKKKKLRETDARDVAKHSAMRLATLTKIFPTPSVTGVEAGKPFPAPERPAYDLLCNLFLTD